MSVERAKQALINAHNAGTWKVRANWRNILSRNKLKKLNLNNKQES